MIDPASRADRPLRIVHCFRAPLGGLFRHVRDLATTQAEAGHAVGLVADSTPGGPMDEAALQRMAPQLALGIHRLPMRREIGPGDLPAIWKIFRELGDERLDVLHGHGAKGGAFARTVGTLLRAKGVRVARFYTAHGGSLQYDPARFGSKVMFLAERVLETMTDAFIFVSEYEAAAYVQKVGKPFRPVNVVYNGLHPAEYDLVDTAVDARDLVFIGEMVARKGLDILIDALALLRERRGTAPSAHFIGSGADIPAYKAQIAERGLARAVDFHAPMPARRAFAMGRVVVMPSRVESMPYLALETIAAGRPFIATRVGGMPEIFGAESGRLVPSGDPVALADAIEAALADLGAARQQALRLREAIRPHFSVATMAARIEAVYRTALAQ